MSCTGIPVAELEFPPQARIFNKTTRLVNMAFEMLKFIDKFRTSKSLSVHLKIGIHEGEVIAGLVGLHKPQFSLIGDTVNTTSRICANGHKGHLTISQQAKNELDLLVFAFEEREVHAKGKGILKIFEVKKRVVGEGGPKMKRVVEKILKMVRENRRNQNFEWILNMMKNSALMREESVEKNKGCDSKMLLRLSSKRISMRIWNKFKWIRVFLLKFLIFNFKECILKILESIFNRNQLKQHTKKILPKFQMINFKAVKPNTSDSLTHSKEKFMKKIDSFTLKTNNLYSNEEFLKQLGLKNWKLEKMILCSLFLVMFFSCYHWKISSKMSISSFWSVVS